ncbi:MAG: biotin-dependent carboxyltransferase family protein [Porticoccaceae bacterium]|nr:biotin-dependent carboxyltransferase [Pseudomonadales bacterium]MCP5171043.1 biotin-dependent carboxyltransferase [Pseudomonadales bacterium]MCP5301718.1 biotin-dependent carboxyltransferase [Pseudomonadales bacterium]
MSGLKVLRPGILCLIQDQGRFGQHRFGLTNGGPLDMTAFNWANRLCENEPGTTALELSVGGLVLEAQQSVRFAITGAAAPLKVNGERREQWRSHRLQKGDVIEVGYASVGLRLYLAVTGGFQVAPRLGSTATVVREGIGGLNGQALKANDCLDCPEFSSGRNWFLAAAQQPAYSMTATLRMLPGYQHRYFPASQQQIFFAASYAVSNHCDRMGYRLEGPAIKADIEGILSEGICHGAVQIPADGQPIVLLNDRQTIGGYPKIGSVIRLDTDRLAQMRPGGTVSFESVSLEQCRVLNAEAHNRFNATEPRPCL